MGEGAREKEKEKKDKEREGTRGYCIKQRHLEWPWPSWECHGHVGLGCIGRKESR